MSRSKLLCAKYSFMPEREQFLLFIRPLNRGCVRYIFSGEQIARTQLGEWVQGRGLEAEWKKVQV